MNNFLNLVGQKSKQALLKKIETKKKDNVLKKYISLIKKEKSFILRENIKDIDFAKKKIK